MENLESLIKTYYDFPKKGIAFYDIATILANPKEFNKIEEKIMTKLEMMSLFIQT